MRYLPHTAEDVRKMLDVIGMASTEDLFVGVPSAVRLQRSLDLPAPAAESALLRELGMPFRGETPVAVEAKES